MPVVLAVAIKRGTTGLRRLGDFVGRLLIAVAILIWASHCARAQGYAYQVDSEPDELWDPSGRAQISGQILIGLMAGEVAGSVPVPATYSELIAGSDTICLSLTSQDGSYRYMQDYAAGPLHDKISLLEFAPTRPEAFASDVSFAMRLSLGGCASDGAAVALVAPSPEALTSGDEIVVLINGLGAERVRLGIVGSSDRHDCARQVGHRATAYDFECLVPLGMLSGEVQVVVERFAGARLLEPSIFTLVVPR